MDILFYDNDFVSVRIKSDNNIKEKDIFKVRDYLKKELKFNIKSIYGVMFKEKNGKVFYEDFKNEEESSLEYISKKIELFLKEVTENRILNEKEIVLDVIPKEYFLDKNDDIIRLIDVNFVDGKIDVELFKGNYICDNLEKTDVDELCEAEDLFDTEGKQYKEVGLKNEIDILDELEFEISPERIHEIEEISIEIIKKHLNNLKEVFSKDESLKKSDECIVLIKEKNIEFINDLFSKSDEIMKERLKKFNDDIKESIEENKNTKEVFEKSEIEKITEMNRNKDMSFNEEFYLFAFTVKKLKGYVAKILADNKKTMLDDLLIMSRYTYVFVNMSKRNMYFSEMKKRNIYRDINLNLKVLKTIMKNNLNRA